MGRFGEKMPVARFWLGRPAGRPATESIGLVPEKCCFRGLSDLDTLAENGILKGLFLARTARASGSWRRWKAIMTSEC